MQLSLGLDPDPLLPQVRARLLLDFGRLRDEGRHDPTSQFVKSLISSRTRDAVSQAAFDRLRRASPSWNALPDQSPDTVEAIIRDVTFAPEKAAFLVAAAAAIRARRGSFDLAFLRDWPTELILAWLRRLLGVGPKIATAVANFSTLRRRVFVADTHCLRVAVRLGLLPPRASDEQAHRMLLRSMPDEWDAGDLYELHWLMKRLGQEHCTDEGPRCPACPLRDLCGRRGVSPHPDPWALRVRPAGRPLGPAGALGALRPTEPTLPPSSPPAPPAARPRAP